MKCPKPPTETSERSSSTNRQDDLKSEDKVVLTGLILRCWTMTGLDIEGRGVLQICNLLEGLRHYWYNSDNVLRECKEIGLTGPLLNNF
jgi:hypothetical protein